MLSDRCLSCLYVCLSVCDVGVLWPNGLTDQDETWHGGRPQPRRHCVSSPHLFDPASPPLKGHNPQFLSNIHCGQTTGWMKTPLGTEVDRGPGHIVLDGVPALRESTAAPIFLAHVYCGHGRPSQLLLSSCLVLLVFSCVRLYELHVK